MVVFLWWCGWVFCVFVIVLVAVVFLWCCVFVFFCDCVGCGCAFVFL